VTFTVIPDPITGAGGTWQPIAGFPTPTLNNAKTSATVVPDSNGYATSPQLVANATAGSFTVTANDGVNTEYFSVKTAACTTNPSVNLLTDNGVQGELRYAVNNACAGSTVDLTQLAGTITLGSRLRIDDNLTINGPGAGNLTISGNNNTRILFIGNGNVSINDLTLANGLGQGGTGGPGAAGMGGAIYQNGGNMTITGVTFSGNLAKGGQGNGGASGGGFGGNGGGVGGSGGDLLGLPGPEGQGGTGGPGAGGTLEGNHRPGNGGFGGGGDPFQGNGGFGGGGGQQGTAGYGASASFFNGGASFGGAIFQYAGTLTLNNDAFTNNTAVEQLQGQFIGGQGKGGAIFVYVGAGAKAFANNVTFSGSIAADAGKPGIGSSPAPYTTGAMCPNEDDADVCGPLLQLDDVPATASSGTQFTVGTGHSGESLSILSGPCTITGNQVTVVGANGSCVIQASLNGVTSTETVQIQPTGSSCVAPPANLTAWYKAEGSATDATGGFNGTLGGDVSFASGYIGQAFSFDGSQSPYVGIPPAVFSYPTSGAFTFETCFKTTGANGGVILGQQSGSAYTPPPNGDIPAIYVGTDGKLYTEMFYSGTVSPKASTTLVNDGAWHHVAITYDATTQIEITYLDGAPVNTANQAQVPYNSQYTYQLGTGYTSGWPAGNNGWYTFNGVIDEATVYSRALSPAEVLTIVNAGMYGKCDPQLAAPANASAGSIAVGQTTSFSFNVSNTGNAPLMLSSLAIDQGDTTFSVVTGANACAANTQLGTGQSCTVYLQYAPTSPGAKSGALTIASNAVSNYGQQVIQLSGGTSTANVTSQVAITSGALSYNRVAGTGTETVTMKNTSGSTINGPIQLVLAISNSKVTAANNTGTYNGNPYWTVDSASLAPGASASVNLTFKYPVGTAFTTTPTVYSGSLQ